MAKKGRQDAGASGVLVGQYTHDMALSQCAQRRGGGLITIDNMKSTLDPVFPKQLIQPGIEERRSNYGYCKTLQRPVNAHELEISDMRTDGDYAVAVAVGLFEMFNTFGLHQGINVISRNGVHPDKIYDVATELPENVLAQLPDFGTGFFLSVGKPEMGQRTSTSFCGKSVDNDAHCSTDKQAK